MNITKIIYKGLRLCLVLLILTDQNGFAQDKSSSPLRLMFYNVENLFDIFNDTLKNDDDFLPHGVLRWNYTRYNHKINSIFKTIVAAGEWSPPEIVAMCEVENRNVLEDLVYGTYLSKYQYRIIHEDSPDQRGIDVCLIFRSDVLKLIDSYYWIPEGFEEKDFTTRRILYSKFLYVKDTIHLIVNHWPSRRGGVLPGESLRMRISQMVREKSDSISFSSPDASKIIIVGDFNSTPDDNEIKILTALSSQNQLVNLSESMAEAGLGTYRYQGTWEMIDQVIVSEKLLNSSTGLVTENRLFSIFKPDFLLMKDPKFPGFTPFATYRGYRYQGGFSDHLPVLLKLYFRGQDQPE
jgi:predicted extracellular nuclease